jgi:hypothetical protein
MATRRIVPREDGEGSLGRSDKKWGGLFATSPIVFVINEYADDAAAEAGGVPIGGIYRTDNTLKIRII